MSLLALVRVLSCGLKSCFSVVEGLDWHVLAGSLFSGTGEQASGRVDVFGKDIQQQAAAANETSICFFVTSHWVGRLMSSRWNTKPLSHGSSSTLHSGLGSVRMFFYLVSEGRVLRDGDTLEYLGGCTGHVTAHVFLSPWRYGCGQDSPRFLGNGYASLVAWVGAGRRGRVVIGVVHLGWEGMVARGPRGSLTTLDSLATRVLGVEELQMRQWSVCSEGGVYCACAYVW